MKLAEILSLYTEYFLGDFSGKDVKSVCVDSRDVEPGSIFVAIPGTASNGHEYIPTAIEKGAIAIVCEDSAAIDASYKGSVVKVDDARRALSQLASKFYNNPSDNLFCIGVTGTNGKTSLTYMVEKIFNDFGWMTGVMGTIDHHIGKYVWNSQLTTPNPVVLQRRLQEMCALDARAAVFEISSHAIEQKRTEGISLDVAIFTNLSRDHLDYHLDMQSYFKAKEKLFSELLPSSSKLAKTAIINSDDSYGQNIEVGPGVKRKSYGMKPGNDYQIFVEEMNFTGTNFRLKTPAMDVDGFLPIIGRFFVYNAVAAIAAAVEAGISLSSAIDSLREFKGVPGRLQRVNNSKGIHVFVDYAHTDDALSSVLKSVQEIRDNIQSGGQIICVFGCGGDRDRGKRPLMMAAAVEYSDLVYVTSDNPRTEDPDKIIQDIIAEVPEDKINDTVFLEVDRKQAIASAISMAKAEDIVIIAGKGHEDYQIIGTKKRHFDDVLCAQEIMSL